MIKTKSQKSMVKTINAKYQDAPKYKQSTDFFAMSNVGFNSNLYDNQMEVAVHLAISTFNEIDGDAERELTSLPISFNMLYDRLNLVDGKNTKRQMLKVREAVAGLVDKEIIRVAYLDATKTSSDRALFIVKQALTTSVDNDGAKKQSRTFLSVEKNVFYKLMLVEADSNRIALMSTYCAIASRIYAYKKPTTVHESHAAQATLNALELPICFATQDGLAEMIGIKSRKTVGTHIESLIDMKLIAFFKVAHSGYQKGQWKYQIAKFEERQILKQYLKFKVESHNRDYIIVDIFDEAVAKEEEEVAEAVINTPALALAQEESNVIFLDNVDNEEYAEAMSLFK